MSFSKKNIVRLKYLISQKPQVLNFPFYQEEMKGSKSETKNSSNK